MKTCVCIYIKKRKCLKARAIVPIGLFLGVLILGGNVSYRPIKPYKKIVRNGRHLN